jgi:hypothetical protein
MHTETPGSPRNLEQSVSYNEHLMPDPDHQRHGAQRILTMGLAGLTCVMAIMWLSSYRFYTSLGLDLDAVEGPSVRYTYLRARWPGFDLGGRSSSRLGVPRPAPSGIAYTTPGSSGWASPAGSLRC